MQKLDTPPTALLDCNEWKESQPASGPHPAPNVLNRIARASLPILLALALCLTIFAVYVPLNPLMPVHGLDMSWMMSMNQAVAQRLVFGKDVIFTFGSYASIYTELYHPATDHLMVWGSVFLAICCIAVLLLLGKGNKYYGLALYGLFLAGFLNSRDALLFSYPLMVSLVVYRLALPDRDPMKVHISGPLRIFLPIIFAPLGFLPLIKGSLLPICGAMAALSFVLLMYCGKKRMALAALVAPAVTCVLLWAASGQPVLRLANFFLSTNRIISGYTEAMAFAGDPWEYGLYILAVASILLAVAWKSNIQRRFMWFLVASFGLFSITAFKAGFVRHDQWHNITAGSSILSAAILLIFIVGWRRSLFPIAMAALTWAFINYGNNPNKAADVTGNVRGTFERVFQGVQKRSAEGELRKEYDQHIAAINREFPIPTMPGTTDIYSFNQSWVLASPNTWDPRPVVQSYSSYTPDLAGRNLDHLKGNHPPDNIIFRIEAIDGRLPSLEDGLSWPAILDGYSITHVSPQAAYFRKLPAAQSFVSETHPDLVMSNPKFGEEISIPGSSEPIFARMEITPTLLGRVLGVLFKPPQLYISVRLADGKLIRYRAISGMMKTDFLISPLVKSTEDFALLAAGGNHYLSTNRVKSITMSSEDRHGLFWKQTYSLNLRTIRLRRNSEAENSQLFDKIEAGIPSGNSRPSTKTCEGSIASINGNRPSSSPVNVTGALSLNGWMAFSAKDGIVPDAVFVALTNENGKTLYFRAHAVPREDVKRHFNQPDMSDPGFAALIDVTNLKGNYTLGLARNYKGDLAICQQFNLPVSINP